MLLKFTNLQNVGVFKDFTWDNTVKTKQDEVIQFDKLNIIYGQNYAGKTTLSRIIRSLETGKFSDKYIDAKFSLLFDDDSELTNNYLGSNQYTIRVFNDEFIQDNLEFISDPDKTITPFAILGEHNKDIEKEIDRLHEILGDENKKTGLYGVRKNYSERYNIYVEDLKNAEKLLGKSLAEKATGKEIGIKYKKKYDKINYDIKALRSDIEKISTKQFIPLNHDEVRTSELVLNENVKDQILEIQKPSLNFDTLQELAAKAITKVVGKSNKIDSLVKNAILNKWVQEGRVLHGPNTICGFCNGTVTSDRWNELERHFDKESENLEQEINVLLEQINKEEISLKTYKFYREDLFYKKFQTELKIINSKIENEIKEYLDSLTKIKNLVVARKNAILEASDYEYLSDKSTNLQYLFEDLENLRHQSNYYTSNLKEEKDTAKESLRLQDIYEYLKEINYTEIESRIKYLKEVLFEIETNEVSLELEIDNLLLLISDHKKLIKDESKGAEKINEYLQNHFGHQNLKLEPVIIKDFFIGDRLGFEVQRDRQKAYHLSEGEKSLIAFCYFIAKLEDIETKGKKPIIWIDDPISSLDGNHIFFIYSLVKSEIYIKKDFSQLFISTHNLNFLKYLKRLASKNDQDNNAVRYFLVERIDRTSNLIQMPKYLQQHVTEFNHLFKSVYDCANITTVNDSNYTLFYNFGNNVRKFLEIYLFYKYPNFENDDSKYKNFFGKDPIPSILTSRLVNEYSHLCGIIERGETPIEIPEMKKTAELILKKIEEKDNEQYRALVKSIQ